jgi:hypothetical protein
MTQHELFTQIVYWLHDLENVTTSITDDELTIKSIDNQVIVKHHPTLAKDERRYLLQYTNQLISGVLEIYSAAYGEWIIQGEILTDKIVFDRLYLLALLGDETLMDRLFLLEQVN